MTPRVRCKAFLKNGERCRYKAKGKSQLCGIHGQSESAKRSPEERESKDSSAERDAKLAKLALLLSAGLALIELVEKAVEKYPELIAILESFREYTGNRWAYEDLRSRLKPAKEFNDTGNVNSLVAPSTRIYRYNEGTKEWDLELMIDPVQHGLKTLAHCISLTYWAVSTALSHYSNDEYEVYGFLEVGEELSLSREGIEYLLLICEQCRSLQFLDELRPSNFGGFHA